MIDAKRVSILFLVAAIAAAQAPEKKPRDGEYDPFNDVVKDIQANNFTKAITDLDIWSQKFPETDYKDDRTAYYVQAYAGANQAARALDASIPLFKRDLTTVFPGTTGQATIVRLLFNVAWAITRLPDPAPEQTATGEKAAHLLMTYDQPISGVSNADWEKLRASMKEQGANTLLYIAMQPGVAAMSKQPPDCPAADAAFTAALGTYPDKSNISYQLARAMNCESKDQPTKLSAAIYEFERAAVVDPTLGDPKGDPQKIVSFADNAYIRVHGSDEGLAQLKQSVKLSPLPPADFKIKTASEIAEEKRVEFEKSNPELALWMKIKGALLDTGGDDYFTAQLKDSRVPRLRGILLEAKPACRSRELTVAVPLPDSPGEMKPEIKLKLEKPLTGKPELNQELHWEGVPSAFSKDPFLLTMDTDTAKIEGLKSTPCTLAPPKK